MSNDGNPNGHNGIYCRIVPRIEGRRCDSCGLRADWRTDCLPHRGARTSSPQCWDPMACVRKWCTAPTSALVRLTFRFSGGVEVRSETFVLVKLGRGGPISAVQSTQYERGGGSGADENQSVICRDRPIRVVDWPVGGWRRRRFIYFENHGVEGHRLVVWSDATQVRVRTSSGD